MTASLPSRCNTIYRGRCSRPQDFDGHMESVLADAVAAFTAAPSNMGLTLNRQ